MNSLTTYYLNRRKEYRKYLRALTRSSSQKDIHSLRLVIKKMRAIYHLLSFCDQTFDFEQHFSPLLEIFKASGKIRDIDVTSKCIPKAAPKKNKKIIETLHKERIRAFRDVRKIARQILLREDPGQDRSQLLTEDVRDDIIMDYLGRVFADIHQECKEKLNTERLHGIRKLCKEYMYVSRAGGKVVFSQSRENLRHLNPLQKEIGRWHDYVITADVIKTTSKRSKMRDRIVITLKNEERKLRKNALKELKILT